MLSVLTDYLRTAMRHARYEILSKDGLFYGEIPELTGVYASAPTLEECRDELEKVLEDWIFVRVSKSLAVPSLDGVELPSVQTV